MTIDTLLIQQLYKEHNYSALALSKYINQPYYLVVNILKDNNIFVSSIDQISFDIDMAINILKETGSIAASMRVLSSYGHKDSTRLVTLLDHHKVPWRSIVDRPQNVVCPYTKEELIDICYRVGLRMCYLIIETGHTAKLLNRWMKEFNINMKSLYENIDTTFKDAINSDNKEDIAFLKYNHPPERLNAFYILYEHQYLYNEMPVYEISNYLNLPLIYCIKFFRYMDITAYQKNQYASKNELYLLNEIQRFYPSAKKRRFNVDNKLYEVDIYIEEIKIGIEYNGQYWHSTKYKHKEYHLEKQNAIESIGIELISVFDYEFNNKLSNILNYILRKYIEVNTFEIKEVEYIDIKVIESYLLCDIMQSQTYYGLFIDNKIVAYISIDNNFVIQYGSIYQNNFLKLFLDYIPHKKYTVVCDRFKENGKVFLDNNFILTSSYVSRVITNKSAFEIFNAGTDIYTLNISS